MSGKRQTNQQQLASGTDGRGETPVAATRGNVPADVELRGAALLALSR